jgi:hypothetical protein
MAGSVAKLVKSAARRAHTCGREDQLATYGWLAEAIGLGAQVIFAMFPVIQGWRR